MSFEEQHLKRILREVKNLDKSVLSPLLVQAGISDSDLNVLVDECENLEENLKSYWEENQDVEQALKSFRESMGGEYLLEQAILLYKDVTPEELNTAIRNADLELRLMAVPLFDFNRLTETAQKVAVKSYIKKWNAENKPQKLTEREAREELDLKMYRFMFDGHLIDEENLESGLE